MHNGNMRTKNFCGQGMRIRNGTPSASTSALNVARNIIRSATSVNIAVMLVARVPSANGQRKESQRITRSISARSAERAFPPSVPTRSIARTNADRNPTAWKRGDRLSPYTILKQKSSPVVRDALRWRRPPI